MICKAKPDQPVAETEISESWADRREEPVMARELILTGPFPFKVQSRIHTEGPNAPFRIGR